MSNVYLMLKGFVIGIAKIIPGVSGAMLAISLGVYEKSLKAIANIFKDFKNSIKYLLPLGIGAILAIVLTSKIVMYFLTNYATPTMLLFIGLIIGGIPSIYKKGDFKKINFQKIMFFSFSFLVVFGISFLGKMDIFTNPGNAFVGYILFVIVGIIDAITMIIPGISGTAVMIILGCYNMLLTALGALTDISNIIANLAVIIPFGLGVIIGIAALAKLMNYLFEKKQSLAYSAVLGFALSSTLVLLFDTLKSYQNIMQLIIGFVLLIIGYFISKKLEN